MQKLMVVDGFLYDMPNATATKCNEGDAYSATELTFAVVLEMADEDTSPSGKDRNQASTGDWIPADAENLGRTHRGQAHSASDGTDPAPKIRPIKTLDSA